MTEFDGDGVVVLSRAKKAKRRPEPTIAATSKVIKTRRVLRCLVGGCDGAGGDTWDGWAVTLVGVCEPGLGNERLSGLLSTGVAAAKEVCLFIVGGVNAEGNELAGVIPDG
jgi:hypothetical protein